MTYKYLNTSIITPKPIWFMRERVKESDCDYIFARILVGLAYSLDFLSRLFLASVFTSHTNVVCSLEFMSTCRFSPQFYDLDGQWLDTHNLWFCSLGKLCSSHERPSSIKIILKFWTYLGFVFRLEVES